jgi:hypothetical protein
MRLFLPEFSQSELNLKEKIALILFMYGTHLYVLTLEIYK